MRGDDPLCVPMCSNGETKLRSDILHPSLCPGCGSDVPSYFRSLLPWLALHEGTVPWTGSWNNPFSLELPSSGYSTLRVLTATTKQLRLSLVMRPEESRILNGNGETLAFSLWLAGGRREREGVVTEDPTLNPEGLNSWMWLAIKVRELWMDKLHVWHDVGGCKFVFWLFSFSQ